MSVTSLLRQMPFSQRASDQPTINPSLAEPRCEIQSDGNGYRYNWKHKIQIPEATIRSTIEVEIEVCIGVPRSKINNEKDDVSRIKSPELLTPKQRSTEDIDAIENLSPPTYSVEEFGSDEDLISKKYRLPWPQRPQNGKHSVDAELGLRNGDKIKMEKKNGKPCKEEESKKDNNKQTGEEQQNRIVEDIKNYAISVCPNKAPIMYDIHSMTMKHATERFDDYQRLNFMMYYRYDDLNSIPMNGPPLMIASKRATDNAIIHYQINCYTCEDENGIEELWCATELGSDGMPCFNNSRLGFSSLRALLERWSSMNANCPDI